MPFSIPTFWELIIEFARAAVDFIGMAYGVVVEDFVHIIKMVTRHGKKEHGS